MSNKKKSNIKGVRNVLATTSLAAMLLANGLAPIAASASTTGTVDIDDLPTLSTVALPTSEKAVFIPNEYIVTFTEGTTNEEIQNLISKYGAEVIDGNSDSLTYTLNLEESQFKQMKDDVNVEIIEQNVTFAANKYSQMEQYSHAQTKVQNAWAQNYKGKGIKIAVLDTGISAHSDLKIAGGVSKVDYTTSYADDNGHGTHVAGIIGSLDDGQGTTGVASEASIYSVKVLQKSGKGNLSDIIAGVDWAIENNMDIINISLGTITNSQSLKKRVDEAEAKGIIVVAAAGNTGDTTLNYPAVYDNVVSVGATDQNNNIASFSTRGDTINVVAPGDKVVSTYLNGIYANGSGTSQAAPYVAGMIALYEQAYPDKSAKEIVDMLYTNSLDLGSPGRDSLYGYGLVQFPEGSQVVTEEVVINDIKPQIDTKADYLTWDAFADTSKYLIEMQQKDANGEFQAYRFNRTVGDEKFDLSLLEKGTEYRLAIKPQVNGKYDNNSAVALYVSVVNDEPKVSTSPINEKKVTKVITKDLSTPLPKGFTFDEGTNTLNWASFADSTYFRIQMEQKQADGTFKKFNYDRTSSNLKFALTPLKDGYEYKMTFVPRDSKYIFQDSQAVSFYVNFKDGKKTFSQVPFSEKATTTTVVEAPKTVEKVVEAPTVSSSIPNGVAFNTSTHLVTWDKIEGAKRYKIEKKVKDANGKYVASGSATTVTSEKFDLDVLTKNKEFQITITPYIGYAYVSDQAVKISVNTKTFTIGSF